MTHKKLFFVFICVVVVQILTSTFTNPSVFTHALCHDGMSNGRVIQGDAKIYVHLKITVQKHAKIF
jgi:hypothetical protein